MAQDGVDTTDETDEIDEVSELSLSLADPMVPAWIDFQYVSAEVPGWSEEVPAWLEVVPEVQAWSDC